jgi:peptidoglycan/LPS O-acetylase OafA/YrhL
VLLPTLAVAALSWTVLERPAQDWARRAIRTRARPAPEHRRPAQALGR